MVFDTFILQLYLKKWARKHQYDKRAEEKQASATIMISIDGKGTVFPVKLKLQRETFE